MTSRFLNWALSLRARSLKQTALPKPIVTASGNNFDVIVSDVTVLVTLAPSQVDLDHPLQSVSTKRASYICSLKNLSYNEKAHFTLVNIYSHE